MRLFSVILLIALLSGCATEQSYPNQDTSYTPPPTTSYKPPKLAGQCVGISKYNVDEMKRLPLQGRRYLYYCNLCVPKKKNPENPRKIVQVSYSRYDDTTWTFNFGDGYPLDAADIYVESNTNQFMNLSKFIGCPATNIQNEWDIKAKKK